MRNGMELVIEGLNKVLTEHLEKEDKEFGSLDEIYDTIAEAEAIALEGGDFHETLLEGMQRSFLWTYENNREEIEHVLGTILKPVLPESSTEEALRSAVSATPASIFSGLIPGIPKDKVLYVAAAFELCLRLLYLKDNGVDFELRGTQEKRPVEEA